MSELAIYFPHNYQAVPLSSGKPDDEQRIFRTLEALGLEAEIIRNSADGMFARTHNCVSGIGLRATLRFINCYAMSH